MSKNRTEAAGWVERLGRSSEPTTLGGNPVWDPSATGVPGQFEGEVLDLTNFFFFF